TRSAGEEAKRTGTQWAALGRGLDSLKTRIVSLVGAYAGFRSVQAIFRSVIAATIEAEAVAAQLEARVESTGGAAGFTAQQLLDMASGLQQVTTFGDEAIAAMQGVLLTFTNVRGEVFVSATEAVLNLAVALDTDLKSAALQVGKALNDPVKGVSALSRAGIQLSEAQQRQIRAFVETNDVASAQRVILGELEKQMGGAA